MSNRLFLILLLAVVSSVGSAQELVSYQELLGEYRTPSDSTLLDCFVFRDGTQLKMKIIGQGTVNLKAIAGYTFDLPQVRPRARLEFLKDAGGSIDRIRIYQKNKADDWIRQEGKDDALPAAGDPAAPASLAGYTGKYNSVANPYRMVRIRQQDGGLVFQPGYAPDAPLSSLGKDRFGYEKDGKTIEIQFKRDARGIVQSLAAPYPLSTDLVKISGAVYKPHISNRKNGFTRADTLQGMLTPLRTCYDVLFYDLEMIVLPEARTIRGSNTIRFRATSDFDRCQIDLYANMGIQKILFHNRELPYIREYNAVFIQFPVTVKAGSVEEIKVIYSGQPLVPDLAALQGGVFWLTNRQKKMWIESVTQGAGASLLWPCKDHLSDRPDSMRIRVTVPTQLTEISNGRLLSKTELPGGQTCYEWYVDYPINTYDVAINAGDYVHFTDTFTGSGEPLALNYYCLSYNIDTAKKYFKYHKAMLALYERDFGPYPFPKDGFTLMEAIYPMEHQGAVGIGPLNSPINSTRVDSSDVIRTMWHESAHEWWGNSVGCKDNADMWIHESFASYAEFYNYENWVGRTRALKELSSLGAENKEPIIGIYDVNNFHMGDMYNKGARMLHALRMIIDDDSLWFKILRGIQKDFRYQTVRTEDIVGAFNRITGKDYTWFFDQYLRYPALPVLTISLQEEDSGLRMKYKWQADVPGFRMPVRVTTAKDSLSFVNPTTDWQTMEMSQMKKKDFKVDTDNFFIGVKIVEQ